MLEGFFDWLEQRQHRWHIANVVIVTIIIAIVDSERLSAFIGCTALAVLALFGAIAALHASRTLAQPRHPFEILLLWLPSLFALAMAAGGLLFAVHGGRQLIGLSVFALHGALLMRIASDQIEGRLPVVLTEPAPQASPTSESAH